MDNLIDDLGARSVDQEELHQVFVSHFGGAKQPAERRITYMRQGGQTALELLYNRDARLMAVRSGAGFQADDLPTLKRLIKKAILDPGPMQYARVVFFSHMPVAGFYRWQDSFQILQVPEHAPRPPYPLDPLNPVLLEVAYTGSTHFQVSIHRRAKRIKEIELILAPLLHPGIRMQPRYMENHWVYEIDGEKFQTVYRQAGYSYDDTDGRSDSFSDTSELAPIRLLDFQKYYARVGLGVGGTLELPDSLA